MEASESIHLPLMLTLTRLAVGLEALSLPDASIVCPDPSPKDGLFGSPADGGHAVIKQTTNTVNSNERQK
jgi:hypothetical protein